LKKEEKLKIKAAKKEMNMANIILISDGKENSANGSNFNKFSTPHMLNSNQNHEAATGTPADGESNGKKKKQNKAAKVIGAINTGTTSGSRANAKSKSSGSSDAFDLVQTPYNRTESKS
jgi:hypothetical protein